MNFKNAKYDDFRNFKTTFCKNYLIPGKTETINVYSRVCRNKIGNCCSSVFFFVGQCNHVDYDESKMTTENTTAENLTCP